METSKAKELSESVRTIKLTSLLNKLKSVKAESEELGIATSTLTEEVNGAIQRIVTKLVS